MGPVLNAPTQLLSDDGRYIPSLQTTIAAIVITWFVVLWSFCILGCLSARKRYRLRPTSPLASAASEHVPGVSIIRPLKGLDPNIFENLESTFKQCYPKFEILFAVAYPHDPVLRVVNDLRVKYPDVPTQVVIGEEVVGVNPKVNNLIRPFRQASYDLLWVIDSGVLVSLGTLARSVDALINPLPSQLKSGRTIGLVHHVPIVQPNTTNKAQHLGSRLEEVFLNTTHAKMYVALNTIGIDSCVVGKSNLYRKSSINLLTGTLKPSSLGSNHGTSTSPTGLPNFGKYLAEDNMIAGAIWHELDLRHSLSCDAVHNGVGDMTLMNYIQRRIRWIRVRKRMVTAASLIEPLTEFLLLNILAAWAIHHLLSVPSWLFTLANVTCWIIVDLDVYSSVIGHPLPSNQRRKFLTIWLLREALALPIWVVAMVGNEVEWRGIRYRILRNGEVATVPSGDKDPSTSLK